MSERDEIAEDRGLLLRYLRGQIDDDPESPFFIDDIFYFLVGRAESRDEDWLRGQLLDEQFARARRGAVIMQLSPTGRAPFMPLLRAWHGS